MPLIKQPLAALTRVPWHNGHGMTTDLVIEPSNAGWADCRWRVGVAEIAASCPFSHLPGLDRLLVPLGPGLSLSVGGAPQRPVGAFEVFAFSGGEETLCHLDTAPGAAPLLAFNLMLRTGRAKGTVQCHAGPVRLAAPGPGALVLLAARGGFTMVGNDDRPIRLDAGEAIVHREADEPLSGEPYRPWSMLIAARAWPVASP
jgi:environmental stress-induced protein Ves